MPFGILGSLVICTILYIGVSAVLTGLVPYKELAVADPMAVAVDKLDIAWFAFAIKIGAIMGLSSVMMVLIYGQTRIFYVMSRDGLLPGVFARVHPKFQTPHINTMIIGVVVAIAAAVTPITLLGDLVSLGTLMAFIIVCFSVLYLRKTQPNLPRPFRTPWSPVTPLLGMATCGYLVFTIFFGRDAAGDYVLTESGSHVVGLIGPYCLVGAVIYFGYGARKSKLRHGLPPRTGKKKFITKDKPQGVE